VAPAIVPVEAGRHQRELGRFVARVARCAPSLEQRGRQVGSAEGGERIAAGAGRDLLVARNGTVDLLGIVEVAAPREARRIDLDDGDEWALEGAQAR
jgi:hypothetical protein